MKPASTQPHPIRLNRQRIRQEGIVVLDGIKGLPSGTQPFVSPDYVICIAHKGHMDILYDDIDDFSEQHTVGVIFPNHSLREISKTDDYLATLIVVDASVLNDPMLLIINHLRYRYEPHPCVKLGRNEYRMIRHIVEGMQETSRIDIPDRHMLLVRQLEFLLRLLSFYRSQKLNETNTNKRVSTQFHNDLSQHFRQHRDVAFYAASACLSTKHFSAVIKQETGHTPAHWIHNHIVAEAKMLLHLRPDLSVQAIADMLGFDEQASFSRYFRRETGQSPTNFRDNKQ